MESPVFIIGCPRSGTTLLSRFLRYSDFGSPVESHFITKYFKIIGSYGDLSDRANFTDLLSDILSERPVMQWELRINIDSFYDELDNYSYSNIVNKLCYTRFQREGYRSWGDKTPHYIRDVNILAELFPESKFIYIVRDGRDVALSLLEKSWGPNNIHTCANYWVECNTAYPQTFNLLKSQRQLFELRYEDFLAFPEDIIKDIFSFLQQQYNEDKMRPLLHEIKSDNSLKWKKNMRNWDQKVFNSVASNVLKRNNYEMPDRITGIHPIFSFLYRLHEHICRFIFLFKVNVIDTIKIKYFGKEPFAD